tara:strand:- start:9980 stop:10933 length:954 start_codon:yes stop_codon:yes gene_type:complete
MLMALLTLITALAISGIAAFYSIVGLMAIFSGAAMQIAIMGGALEVGKLVTASWLYQNWRNKNLGRTLKTYLFTAVIVLIFITSIGIFGFLSKAHLDQVKPAGNNQLIISTIDKQIAFEEKQIARAESTIAILDAAMEKYIDMEYVTRGLKERKKQEEEREALNAVIKSSTNKIVELNNEKFAVEKEQIALEADVGPLKYIAELVYGDNAKDMLDEAVRGLIIIFIFVFDPLAVLLLVSANISFRTTKEQKENKIKKRNQLEHMTKKYERLQKRQKNLKKKIKTNTTPIRTIVQDQGNIRKVTKSVGNVETSQYEEI